MSKRMFYYFPRGRSWQALGEELGRAVRRLLLMRLFGGSEG